MSQSEALDERIAGMDVWHLSIPVRSRRDHGIGTVSDAVEIVVVRLTGESGIQAYGEASPWCVFTGTPEANFAALDRYLRPLVVGARVGDWRTISERAQRTLVHCTEAKAALETALLDLAGRCQQTPVWALLGEKCRDEIPLSVSLANPDFGADLALLERLWEDGVRIVKLKTGFKDHAFDRLRLETLKSDWPSMDVRVDYNQGLDTGSALACVKDLDSLCPSFIEQPVAAHEFETMAALREQTVAPLLADESVFGPEDLRRALAEGICDGVSVKIMKSGGLVRGMEVAAGAAQRQLPAYGGDMFESGLAHLAGTHMIAVSPNISLGCEFFHSTYYLTEDILTAPFPIENGAVQVPDGPGLGVDVNPDALEKFAIARSSTTARQ